MTEDKGILIQNIYYMLSYAFQELKQNNYKDIEGEKFKNIYELFAEILAKGVAYQLKQGLHKEYITHLESLTTLKGKLDINGTIRNKLKRDMELSCSHDELSVNCTFNQILKTTMKILVNATDVNNKRKATLKKHLYFFSEVDTLDASNGRHSDSIGTRIPIACSFISAILSFSTIFPLQ